MRWKLLEFRHGTYSLFIAVSLKHEEPGAAGADEDRKVHPAPEAVAGAELVGHLVGKQEQPSIARLAQQVDSLHRARLRLRELLADFALRLQARELPFLHVELAVAVEVEALLEAPRVLLPLREQGAHVGALLAGCHDRRTGGAELADGIK